MGCANEKPQVYGRPNIQRCIGMETSITPLVLRSPQERRRSSLVSRKFTTTARVPVPSAALSATLAPGGGKRCSGEADDESTPLSVRPQLSRLLGLQLLTSQDDDSSAPSTPHSPAPKQVCMTRSPPPPFPFRPSSSMWERLSNQRIYVG